MEAAQQRTGWPIGRKKRQESGGRLGATPENTGMLGRTEATRSKEARVADRHSNTTGKRTQHIRRPGKATKRGKESKKQHPASEGTAKNATAQPAPAQKLVKAS